jgi:nitrite reductase/ring-hydroxylating ferredoxin subunit
MDYMLDHGVIYHPVSGGCISGPCRGQILEKLNITVSKDVLWVAIY